MELPRAALQHLAPSSCWHAAAAADALLRVVGKAQRSCLLVEGFPTQSDSIECRLPPACWAAAKWLVRAAVPTPLAALKGMAAAQLHQLLSSSLGALGSACHCAHWLSAAWQQGDWEQLRAAGCEPRTLQAGLATRDLALCISTSLMSSLLAYQQLQEAGGDGPSREAPNAPSRWLVSPL